MILSQLAHFASHTVNSLALFQEGEATVSFSPMGLWNHMGWLARAVAILLFIESIWSLAVMIDRYLYFSAARKQSREFAPKVAGALKSAACRFWPPSARQRRSSACSAPSSAS